MQFEFVWTSHNKGDPEVPAPCDVVPYSKKMAFHRPGQEHGT